MRKTLVSLVFLALILGAAARREQPADVLAELVRLERGALDRWGKGDPGGFLEVYAPEVTYFDPQIANRIDGLDSMRAYLKPLTGLVKVDRYEMIGAKVQRYGDAALLSYNLVSRARMPDGSARVVRWNSSTLYARLGGRWKTVHSHWSYTKPNVGPQPAG